MTDQSPQVERPNARTLVGVFALGIFLIIYGLLISEIHVRLGDIHIIIETVFYVVAGLAWLWPAKWLIKWILAPGVKEGVDAGDT